MYYIIENQHRPDGLINHSSTGRDTFGSALSFYHERISKMAVNIQFTKVDVALLNADLTTREIEHVPTMYVPPVVEETEEETEQ